MSIYTPLALLHTISVDYYYRYLYFYWFSLNYNFKCFKKKNIAFNIWKLDLYFKIALNELISLF